MAWRWAIATTFVVWLPVADVHVELDRGYPKEYQQWSEAAEATAYLKAAYRLLDQLPPEFRQSVEAELQKDWLGEEGSLVSRHGARGGSGIVISAGGPKGWLYVPMAYVSAHVLRKMGCTWPIELWYDGTSITRWHRGLLESVGVTLVDLEEVVASGPLKSPWTLDLMKPAFGAWKDRGLFTMIFAVEQTDLDVVTLLNADLVPMTNLCQDSLWETPDGLQGPRPSAFVFPDFYNLSSAKYFPKKWEWLGVPIPREDQPESEGGIVLVDKLRCPNGMRTFFEVIRANFNTAHELGESAMEDDFPSENPMWRPVWAKAGCHCALSRYSLALGGYRAKFNGFFLGVGKISRGFPDGRMLGLHYQWGKSMIQFRRPHPAMFPLNPLVEIGEGFAESGWWGMPHDREGVDTKYLGWSTGEWMMSLNCNRDDVPCTVRPLHEWTETELVLHVQDAWAAAFAIAPWYK